MPPKQQESAFKNFTFLHFMLFLLLIMVILSFFSTRLQTAQISYSTFLREIQTDNVKELNIRGDRIEGILETEIEDNEHTFTKT